MLLINSRIIEQCIDLIVFDLIECYVTQKL